MSITPLVLSAKIEATGAKEAEAQIKKVGEAADKSSGASGGGGLKGFLGGMLSIAGGIGITNLAGNAFGFVKDQLGDMISAGMEANRTQAQTEAVLKSTHGAAGMTTKAVNDLATAMLNKTGIDDDATQAAENMLLTFTNIHSNVFPQTTQAVADMATAMNGGATPSAEQLRQTAIQVGKALQDPIQGVTALQKVGVKLTDQQKEQVAAMMKAGDTAGAQKIILGELNKEFGGQAEAAGKANGGIGILTAQMNNAKQTIGQALIPALTSITTAVVPLVTQVAQKLAPAIANFVTYLSQNKPVLIAVGAVIGTVLVAAFAAWAISAASAAVATIAATWPVLAIVAGIALLVGGIIMLVSHWSQVSAFFGNLFGAIGGFFGRVFGAIGSFFGNLFGAIGGFFGSLLGFIGNLAKMYLELITWPYRMAWQFITTILATIGDFLHSAWDTIVKDVGAVVEGIWTFVSGVFQRDWAFIQAILAAIKTFLSTAWNTIVTDARNIIEGLWTAVSGVFQRDWAFIQAILAAIRVFLTNAWNTIVKDVGNVLGGMKKIAENVWNGIVGAFKSGINLAIGAVNGFIDMLDRLQIHIPAISVGPVSTPAFNWNGPNIPHIPYLAKGGVVTEEGDVVVGDDGPERLRLPRGASVIPLPAGMSGAGGGGSAAPIEIPVTLTLDGRVLAQVVVRHQPGAIRAATGNRGF